MSDPVLQAVQKFMDAVEARLVADKEEIRGMLAEIQTRAVPVEGPQGPAGPQGEGGIQGPQGEPGPAGAVGERGTDGIATREEVEEVVTRKVNELEARSFADFYHGVYKPDTDYTRGSLATWDGSLWLAQVETRLKPGDKNADWKLVVKKGRDK